MPATDLSFTDEQGEKLLEAVHHCLFWAQMDSIDTICYGGDAAAAGAKERGIQKIYETIPKPVWEEFYRRQRKAKADKLRAKADAVERGEDLED